MKIFQIFKITQYHSMYFEVNMVFLEQVNRLYLQLKTSIQKIAGTILFQPN